MHEAHPHPIGRLFDASKLFLLLVSYLPFAVNPTLIRAGNQTVVMTAGAYLLLSQILRHWTRLRRLSPLFQAVWVVADLVVWNIGFGATRWSAPMTWMSLILVTDAALVGWPLRRGVIHAALASAPVLIGPRFSHYPDFDQRYLIEFLFPLLPGLIFVYFFVYFGMRMREEQDEAARARTVAELANTQLREYARQVEEAAVLRERTRVAREVHDTIAHAFTGIIMQMEAISRLVRRDPVQAERAISQVQEHASQSLSEVRRSVHALRPIALDEQPGPEAVGNLVAEFMRTTGVETDLQVAGPPAELPAAHELCLFRAAQEGLTNAFRHGRATRARVRLSYSAAEVTLTVEDNGRGAGAGSGAGPGDGQGIVGIRERAAVLGACWTKDPSPREIPGGRGVFSSHMTLCLTIGIEKVKSYMTGGTTWGRTPPP